MLSWIMFSKICYIIKSLSIYCFWCRRRFIHFWKNMTCIQNSKVGHKLLQFTVPLETCTVHYWYYTYQYHVVDCWNSFNFYHTIVHILLTTSWKGMCSLNIHVYMYSWSLDIVIFGPKNPLWCAIQNNAIWIYTMILLNHT